MNCQEFDEIWNRLLDDETLAGYKRFAGLEVPPHELVELEGVAIQHARKCQRCCQAQAWNRKLREALRAWAVGDRKTLAHSPRLEGCSLAEPSLGSPRLPRRWKARLSAGAALVAAAILIAVVLTSAPDRLWHTDREGNHPGRGTSLDLAADSRSTARQADAKLLSEAVSDATAATWNLARSTSQPAAWLGRDVFKAATFLTAPLRSAIRKSRFSRPSTASEARPPEPSRTPAK
jgi:hypothetical protein